LKCDHIKVKLIISSWPYSWKALFMILMFIFYEHMEETPVYIAQPNS